MTRLPDIGRFAAHVLFWACVLAFYTVYFGAREDQYGQAMFFVALLMPITVATTYFILYWLIPRYALAGRYVLFGIYLVYTLTASVYAELMMLTLLYIYVSDYQALFVGPGMTDQLNVLVGMYAVVLIAVAVRMWRSLTETRLQASKLEEERWRSG